MESNTNINNTAQVQSDEISLKELILKIREWYRYLLTKWKVILLAGIVGGALGYAYAYFKKPLYTASCTFVLDEGKSGGGLSQYAGLAAMAGINIGGGASDGLFQGDNIMELYKSRTMLQKTLLSYGEFDGKKDLLINRYIQINKMREGWAKNVQLKDLSFDIPVRKFSRLTDSVMTAIIEDINKNYLKVDKKEKNLSIIQVDVKSKDEQFAKYFADNVVSNVNAFYIETKTKKQSDNIAILRYQADSVRKILDSSISGAATAIDANPNANPALQILRVPSQRRQIDIQTNSAMYAEIIKNLEMAKLSALQESPLIQLIDEPVFPLKMVRSSKLISMIIGVCIFSFLTVIGYIYCKLIRSIIND